MQSYQRIVDAFHRGVIDAGAQSRILHVTQARDLGAAELAARFPVLVAPGAVRRVRRRPRPAARLRRGRRAPRGRHPHGLRRRGGARARRGRARSAPRARRACTTRSSPTCVGSRPRHGRRRIRGIRRRHRRALGRRAPRRRRRGARPLPAPAVRRLRRGDDQRTATGASPSSAACRRPASPRDLVRWAVPSAVADELAPPRELPVTVSSGTLPDGRRAWFVFNWSWTDTVVRVGRAVTDPYRRRPPSPRAPNSPSPHGRR